MLNAVIQLAEKGKETQQWEMPKGASRERENGGAASGRGEKRKKGMLVISVRPKG